MIPLSLTVQSTHSTMMDRRSWITYKDMDTLKVHWIMKIQLFFQQCWRFDMTSTGWIFIVPVRKGWKRYLSSQENMLEHLIDDSITFFSIQQTLLYVWFRQNIIIYVVHWLCWYETVSPCGAFKDLCNVCFCFFVGGLFQGWYVIFAMLWFCKKEQSI